MLIGTGWTCSDALANSTHLSSLLSFSDILRLAGQRVPLAHDPNQKLPDPPLCLFVYSVLWFSFQSET